VELPLKRKKLKQPPLQLHLEKRKRSLLALGDQVLLSLSQSLLRHPLVLIVRQPQLNPLFSLRRKTKRVMIPGVSVVVLAENLALQPRNEHENESFCLKFNSSIIYV
jgi:hypothetical protein